MQRVEILSPLHQGSQVIILSITIATGVSFIPHRLLVLLSLDVERGLFICKHSANHAISKQRGKGGGENRGLKLRYWNGKIRRGSESKFF
jgi:hypothetical protein